MGAEKFGDFFGPAFDFYASGVGVTDFASPVIELADAAPEDEGDLGIWKGEDCAHDFANMRHAASGEE